MTTLHQSLRSSGGRMAGRHRARSTAPFSSAGRSTRSQSLAPQHTFRRAWRSSVGAPEVSARTRASTSSSSTSTSSTVVSSSTAPSQELRVWLSSRDVERTIRLQVLPEGTGQVVVVAEVDPDSAAAQAGVELGQKLVGISDPVRDSEVWDLGDRPSLRFVRDTLRMRRMGQVQLVLAGPVPTYVARLTPPPDAAAATAAAASPSPPPAAQASPLDPAGGTVEDGSSLRAVSALESLLSGSESDGDAPPHQSPQALTVGERMAAEFAARQQATQQVSDVNKRIARRAAYMDEVSQRNDAPLAVGLLVAFLGPALVILAVAGGSGYLERLYDASLTLR